MVVATHHSRELLSNGDEREPTDHGGPDDEPGPHVLEPGVYVDRYRIDDVVGSGGIGVVYLAFDEVLGRNVALKLLRPSSRSSARLERRRARLIREAHALARLSHPNVVPIYEVGMFDDRVFLAMEYVRGSTMRRWLRAGMRSIPEILDKYMQAGRGLAAAHAADIVHRDFKPDNVLVGEDQRVRVLDFGLATPVPEALSTGRFATLGSPELDAPRLSESVGSLGMPPLVTAHGKVMGTPAYMAPEQARGEVIDARADQYAFCVSLWEALFGERPVGPPTATGRIRLARRLSEHNHSGKDVPQVIQRALERGLSIDPADRFPDMNSLLAELAPKPANWRRWALLSAVGSIALVAGTAAMFVPSDETVEQCVPEPERLAGVWDQPTRERIGKRLTAGDRSYARATWEAVGAELDRWSARWLDARVATCEAAKPHGDQPVALMQLRLACLDEQLGSLAAITTLLASEPANLPDADRQLERALAATLELPDPARCDHVSLLGGDLLHDDTGDDEDVQHGREQLNHARALLSMAKPDEALAIVDAVLADADAGNLGDDGRGTLRAEAELLRGRIFVAAGQRPRAREQLRDALMLAQQLGHDAMLIEAGAALIDVLVADGELERAQDWAELARATVIRLGGDAQLEAELHLATAGLARARGQLADAREELDLVLALREQAYGQQHVELAEPLLLRADVLAQLHRTREAEADVERALDLLNSAYGITHPEVGRAYVRAAAVASARGDRAEALAKLLDARAIFELAHGPTHARVLEVDAMIAAQR